VLEHLDDPSGFFAEAARTTKPGGYFCARTANKWGYVTIASRLIPNHLHRRVLRRVQADRAERDVFPTRYRCNTRGVLAKLLRENGFSEHVVYGYEAEPSYLSFSGIAYALGVLHQRLAPRAIRAALFVFARRDS
jgi:SAM-dependent methyltransferase